MRKHTCLTLFASSLARVWVVLVSPAAGAANPIQKGEMAGCLLVPSEKVPVTFNAGFSMYVGAWPKRCQSRMAAICQSVLVQTSVSVVRIATRQAAEE